MTEAEKKTDKKLEKFLPAADQARVVEAIHAAEQKTSGQVKVHIEPRGPGGDVMTRAQHVFHALKLTETKARNAVLIYVASAEQRFAIIGDEGIHRAVGDDFWKEAAEKMSVSFAVGKIGDGLVAAIGAVGDRLREKFPHEDGAQNEIPDDISTST